MPTDPVPYKVSKECFAAGLGCAIADGTFNTFATACVKLQLTPPTNPPLGLTKLIRDTIKEEGIWRGLGQPGLDATILRAATYVSFRIGLFPTVKNFISGDAIPNLSDKIIAGGITGVCGSALFCPIDIIRIRAQADAGVVGNDGRLETGVRKGERVRHPNGVFRAFGELYSADGLSGLYRGATPTIVRAGILSASQLSAYDTLKGLCRDWLTDGKESPVMHTACSFSSGIIAQTCVQPFDTLRAFYMGSEGPTLKKINALLKAEGVGWFYRGYKAACFRQGPLMIVQMPIVEMIRSQLGLGYF